MAEIFTTGSIFIEAAPARPILSNPGAKTNGSAAAAKLFWQSFVLSRMRKKCFAPNLNEDFFSDKFGKSFFWRTDASWSERREKGFRPEKIYVRWLSAGLCRGRKSSSDENCGPYNDVPGRWLSGQVVRVNCKSVALLSIVVQKTWVRIPDLT